MTNNHLIYEKSTSASGATQKFDNSISDLEDRLEKAGASKKLTTEDKVYSIEYTLFNKEFAPAYLKDSFELGSSSWDAVRELMADQTKEHKDRYEETSYFVKQNIILSSNQQKKLASGAKSSRPGCSSNEASNPYDIKI